MLDDGGAGLDEKEEIKFIEPLNTLALSFQRKVSSFLIKS
jgi:hypothetical protein